MSKPDLIFVCGTYAVIIIATIIMLKYAKAAESSSSVVVVLTIPREKDDTAILACDDEVCKHKILEEIANRDQDKLINDSLLIFPKPKP